MGSLLRPTGILLLAFTALLGLAYPACMTGAGHLLFRQQAHGSVLTVGQRALGSSLIGQTFVSPENFWGRPSATTPLPYNASASTGSNLGPSNRALFDSVRARVEALRSADPGNLAPVPIDLVTASGSRLDPHISPAAAYYQAPRVARARGLSEAAVRRTVEEHVERAFPWSAGEPTVNVLELNLALRDLPAERASDQLEPHR